MHRPASETIDKAPTFPKNHGKLKAAGCLYLDLPLTDYEAAWRLQREITAARKEHRLDKDVVLALEHPPVFTLGRNGGRENLVVPEDELTRMNIPVVQIERGGNITYHGPGQLVVYPIIDIGAARLGIRDYVGCLEEAMIRTAAEWDVAASGHPVNRGVWVQNRKLGSVGVSVTHGITFHGLALNVNTRLTPFTWINPCGFRNIRMTSLASELGRDVPMEKVRKAFKRHLAWALNKEFTDVDGKTLEDSMQHPNKIHGDNPPDVDPDDHSDDDPHDGLSDAVTDGSAVR